MEPALEPFKAAMKKIFFEKPLIPVHSNIDGKIYQNVDQILRQLPKQIVKPVKWEQLLHNIYERPQGEKFPRTFECAPGQSLMTILKMVNAKAWDTTHTVDNSKLERDQAKLEREQ
jgi:[acyl-carrier-protein] S-malonyltransferase